MYSTVPGPFHEEPTEPIEFEEELPIGIVVSDFADAAAYVMAPVRGLPTPYYIIRTADDVPARLGGVAVLRKDAWPEGLADALAAALGISGDPL